MADDGLAPVALLLSHELAGAQLGLEREAAHEVFARALAGVLVVDVGGRVGAEQLAAWCGTIPYEIVSRIHPGLPRLAAPHGAEALDSGRRPG